MSSSNIFADLASATALNIQTVSLALDAFRFAVLCDVDPVMFMYILFLEEALDDNRS